MRDKWTENILTRFEGREDLGKQLLYEKYFKPIELDEKEVFLCFEEIELSYNIPIGVLRPDDKITKLTERIATKNMFEWFWWLGKNEFSDDAWRMELNSRLRQYGTFNIWKSIETFDDLVRAWCGQKPK